MAVIYVTEQGALLTKKSGRLIISKGSVVQADVPLIHVEQIVAYGNVHLTTPVIVHCFQEGIDVCFLSSQGAYRGRLQVTGSRDVDLRRQQYARCGTPAFALAVAQAIVCGKIQNQIAFWHRRARDGAPVQDALVRQKALLEKASGALTLESLRGFEGAAALLHFRVFAEALRQQLPYPGKRERPARDPVNAMLNLGYTLLYNNVHAALAVVGLDPYLGCLHQSTPGHAALASDLVEEFRAVVVDALLVTLINHREVTAADFRRSAAGSEARLLPTALRRFLNRYHQRLDTPTLYTPKNARFTYRQIFELQARHLARVMRGEEVDYHPFRWDW